MTTCTILFAFCTTAMLAIAQQPNTLLQPSNVLNGINPTINGQIGNVVNPLSNAINPTINGQIGNVANPLANAINPTINGQIGNGLNPLANAINQAMAANGNNPAMATNGNNLVDTALQNARSNGGLANGVNGPTNGVFNNPTNGFNGFNPSMPTMGGGAGFAALLQSNGASLNQMFQQCRGTMCQSTLTGIKYYSCDLMFFGAYNGMQCGPNAIPVPDCVGITCSDATGSTYNSCTLRGKGYDGYTCAPGSFAQAAQRRPLASSNGQCEGITCVNVLTGMERTYMSCDLVGFGFDGKSCGAGFRPKGSCGAYNYNAQCAPGYCCSGQGYCGQDDNYCNAQSMNASSGFPYNNGLGGNAAPNLNAMLLNSNMFGQNGNNLMPSNGAWNGYNMLQNGNNMMVQNGGLYGNNMMPIGSQFGQNPNAMLQQNAALNGNNFQQNGNNFQQYGNAFGQNPNTVLQTMNGLNGNGAQMNAPNGNAVLQNALAMNRAFWF